MQPFQLKSGEKYRMLLGTKIDLTISVAHFPPLYHIFFLICYFFKFIIFTLKIFKILFIIFLFLFNSLQNFILIFNF